LFGPAGLAINPSLYKLNFDPFRDLKPIIQVSVEQYILVVRNDLRAAEPHDLARLAKGKPGGLDCAAPPGVMLMACEQLRLQWAGGVTIVPYAGIAPAVNALLGGQVDLIFVPTEAVLGQVRAGRLRALANAGEHKIGSPFPDLPLLSDVWPGFTASGMYGVLAPAGTSADTVRMLNEHLNEVISSAPVRERMLGGWQVPIGGTPERYGEALRRGHDYYQKVIRAAGIGLQ
jgi:tripartite-type tricarboxylate transporter receptor subunit TctC